SAHLTISLEALTRRTDCPQTPTLYTNTLPIDVADAHSHLLPFPTRRSSDLGACAVLPDSADLLRSAPAARAASAGEATRIAESRSEKHTSELQSRFDLVCRLLLEKKKDELQVIHAYKSVSLDSRRGTVTD